MRRVLAITLLIAFGSPLVLPLLAATADPEASLPACCRRHGTHRCSMLTSSSMSPTSPDPAFQALPCPFYPSPSTPPTFAAASLQTSLPPGAELPSNPAPRHPSPRRARTFIASANLNRGPPLRLA